MPALPRLWVLTRTRFWRASALLWLLSRATSTSTPLALVAAARRVTPLPLALVAAVAVVVAVARPPLLRVARCPRPVVPRLSRLALVPCWWPVVFWPAGSFGKH